MQLYFHFNCSHQISLAAYHQLENETLSAELSFKGDNVIHIVEQVTCHKVCNNEKNNIKRLCKQNVIS